MIAVAAVLVAVGLVVTVRAVRRRGDVRTRWLLESLQERARAAWTKADKRPGFEYPRGIRAPDQPEKWDDGWRLSLDTDNALENVACDRWGKPIRLRIPGLVHFRGYDLWSCGPNRTDDKGEGDDILIGEDLETEAEYTKRVLGDVAARVSEAKPIPAAADARDPSGLHALAAGLWGQGIHGSHAIEFSCVRTREAVFSFDTDGFYSGSIDPIEAGDAWNRLIYYRCPGPVHAKGWDLYSLGPNGVDDHGRGDDILVGEDAPAGR